MLQVLSCLHVWSISHQESLQESVWQVQKLMHYQRNRMSARKHMASTGPNALTKKKVKRGNTKHAQVYHDSEKVIQSKSTFTSPPGLTVVASAKKTNCFSSQ